MIITADQVRGLIRPAERRHLGDLDFGALASAGLQIFGTVAQQLNATEAAHAAQQQAALLQQQIQASLALQANAQAAAAQAATQRANSVGGFLSGNGLLVAGGLVLALVFAMGRR